MLYPKSLCLHHCCSRRLILAMALVLARAPVTGAQNVPPHIPPPGIPVPDADRQELRAEVDALGKHISALKRKFASDAPHLSLLPDVEVFHKAVDWALRYDEFFETKQITFAKTVLRQGRERA